MVTHDTRSRHSRLRCWSCRFAFWADHHGLYGWLPAITKIWHGSAKWAWQYFAHGISPVDCASAQQGDVPEPDTGMFSAFPWLLGPARSEDSRHPHFGQIASQYSISRLLLFFNDLPTPKGHQARHACLECSFFVMPFRISEAEGFYLHYRGVWDPVVDLFAVVPYDDVVVFRSVN